jgi:O-antigen/teichoic acid export membrane protein
LRELGFGSALLASYGLLEQITDMALYRFVMTTRREEHAEALACAHALSLLRGITVCAVAVLTAPWIAEAFSLRDYWGDFALMGGLVLIKSFENFGPRVAEREFHFAAQLKTGLIANAISLVTLVVMLVVTHDHNALLASLYALIITYVIASHIFSETPYRISFRSSLFSKAYRFSFPLLVNGLGLALSSQADRFLVGYFLGLPTLGIYSLISTAVVLPTNMVWRITGGVNTAMFYKVIDSGKDRAPFVALAGFISSAVAAAYSIGVLLLLNIMAPIVFGSRFVISREALMILAFVAFVRIVRGEPFGSMLLLEGRTKRLALINICVALGVASGAGLMVYFARIESALAARLIGESFGLASAVYLTRTMLLTGFAKFSLQVVIGALLVASCCWTVYATSAGALLSPSLVALCAYALIVAVWTGAVVGPSLQGRLAQWRLRLR